MTFMYMYKCRTITSPDVSCELGGCKMLTFALLCLESATNLYYNFPMNQQFEPLFPLSETSQ